MTEKPISSSEQIIYNLINRMMDKCESHSLARFIFEKQYINEGYKLDWNKRLDKNGNWQNKNELQYYQSVMWND